MYKYLFNNREEFLINYQKIIDNIDNEIPYRTIFLVSVGINPHNITEIPINLPSLENVMIQSVKYTKCDSLSKYLINKKVIVLNKFYLTTAAKFLNKTMLYYLKNIKCPRDDVTKYYLFKFYSIN